MRIPLPALAAFAAATLAAVPGAAITIIPVDGANFADFSFTVDDDARLITINEVWDADTAERALLRFEDFSPALRGYAVQKTITNLTGSAFTSFSLELLRDDLSASPDNDGLSFGQIDNPRVPRTSDRFTNLAVDEFGLRDFLNFTGGRVANGQSVTFGFGLANRRDEGGSFFLAQESNFAGAVVPEPATWAMLIAGFGLVGFAARRRGSPSRVSA